ncbi:Probable ABC transporter ATP-binding protein HI_0664 [Dermatophilus congolensis]|uniref:Probable ABC transporter ATP-binding protein HI_0664 n=1 Tax=Dermatophilus congolensis TaxID=1863 RepID=A0AA46BLH4_9MICO|nr:ATP-binding cassette domain-containing protein [Dermatophilus congolensis]STD04043.1 Probable ABC transporter ATP-binding protein HI_0664 [Dermatophilus congolensis]
MKNHLNKLISHIIEPRLWNLATQHPRLLATTTALTITHTLTYWLQALFLALALAALATPNTPLPTIPLTAALTCILARTAISHALAITSARLGEKIRTNLRTNLLNTLLAPTRLHDTDERLGARRLALTDGIDGIDAYTTRYIPTALTTHILCPTAVILLAFLNPWAALTTALFLTIAIHGPRLWKKTMTQRGHNHWDSYEQLSADHLESLRTMPTLRVLGAVNRRRQLLQHRSDTLHRHTVATMRISLADTGIIDLGIQAGLTTAAILAALTATGNITTPTTHTTIGPFTGAAITYLILLMASETFRPVRDLARHWHSGYLGLTALDSIDTALGNTTPTKTPHPTTDTDTDTTLEALTATNIHFSYTPEHPVLTGANLHLTPGKLTALTGPSGSGKTTLFDILLGLLTPDTGTVAHPGRIAVVSQHSYLFPGTIADTLRTAAPHASEQQLWQALEAVGLDTEIRTWPDQLNTRLGEAGTGISGGQRQRLAIARALLADAAVLLLDEPTSALDDHSASIVCQTLRNEARNRIVLMIAHRPEALAAAEQTLRITDHHIEHSTTALGQEAS